ncbi:MAG: hypothetical protein K5790_10545 [Nitrosopumilus sp.]|uniref:hypothetical protein n=1 Tax=Nitrosopumilus sp. TaxID=2024843 RepID=UPI00247ED016|nr:hypothetical protein [Nitrosopumilus sp.]MCV0393709.1 hypothetical protein [Nitrosopumilus sp.]
MSITIVELLGKIGKFYSVSKNRGFYELDNINDVEIELLKEYLKFESFDISTHHKKEGTFRFYINLPKGDKK